MFSPASAGAAQLPDAVGPDRVPVSIRIEPAIDRYRRWRRMLTVPPVLTNPVGAVLSYQYAPGLMQKYVLKNRWAIDVEADSGEHYRVMAPGRERAIEAAQEIHQGVTTHGVVSLATLLD